MSLVSCVSVLDSPRVICYSETMFSFFLKKRTYNCVSCVRMLFSLESIPDSFTVGINLFVLCCCVSISVRPYHSLRVFVSNSETNNVPLLSSIVFLQK